MSGQSPNRGSFQRGVSGNPGGRPAAAEVSAAARRYTYDWLNGLVGVVRLPVCKENASHIVAAARELREVGYPGLTKAAPEVGTTSLHLHLLAVTREAQGVLQAVQGPGQLLDVGVLDAGESGTEESGDSEACSEPLDPSYLLKPTTSELPHEALPLWDAADERQEEPDVDQRPDRAPG